MSGDTDFMETEDVSKSTEKSTPSDKLAALAVPEKSGDRDAVEEVKKKSGSPETVPISPASQSSGNVTPTAFGQRPCLFFAKGICRHGNSCRFSHSPSAFREDTSVSSGAMSSSGAGGPNPMSMSRPAPPPVVVNIPPGHPVYSIDVECVATGVQHNARSLAQVALVDEWGRPVFNVLIKQDLPVVSYITELTGLTKELLDAHGMPLAEGLALLRAHLPPNAILVGQNILKDVQWLQLAEGVDYHSLIDLSALFRVWNPSRSEYTGFSQDHCAKVWLGIGDRPHHNAMEDAAISMSLFNSYRMVQWDPQRLFQLQMMTLNSPRVPGFSSRNPTVDGCCMGNRKKCSCGAPFL